MRGADHGVGDQPRPYAADRRGGAVYITLAYTLGNSAPMPGVMLGGRALIERVPILTRNSAAIQRAFGALMILVAVAIGFGLDLRFQNALLGALPNYGAGLTAIEEIATVRGALEARAAAATEADGVRGQTAGRGYSRRIRPRPSFHHQGPVVQHWRRRRRGR